MFRSQVVRVTTKIVVAIGILLSMLLAGGAPSGHTNRGIATPTQVGP